MRIVLDTNIYIAAFLKGGYTAKILRMANGGLFKLLVSEPILKELSKKLTEKFEFPEELVDRFIQELRLLGEIASITKRLEIIAEDPDDNKILECASEGKADLIITSDRHLLKLKRFQKAGIIHPRTLRWVIPQLDAGDNQ